LGLGFEISKPLTDPTPFFSIMGTIRLTPEFFNTLFNKGFQGEFHQITEPNDSHSPTCSSDSYCRVGDFTSGLNGYWVWLFIVSKM